MDELPVSKGYRTGKQERGPICLRFKNSRKVSCLPHDIEHKFIIIMIDPIQISINAISDSQEVSMHLGLFCRMLPDGRRCSGRFALAGGGVCCRFYFPLTHEPAVSWRFRPRVEIHMSGSPLHLLYTCTSLQYLSYHVNYKKP